MSKDYRIQSVPGKRIAYALGKAGEGSLLPTEFGYALRRTVTDRIRRGLVRTYRPVLDEAPYRVFATMEEYARWCEGCLPSWLGYGKAA